MKGVIGSLGMLVTLIIGLIAASFSSRYPRHFARIKTRRLALTLDVQMVYTQVVR